MERLATDTFTTAIVRWLNEFAQHGVLTTDTNLVIRSWNRWLEVNTGHAASSVVGRSLFEAFPELAKRGFAPYYQSTLVGEVNVLAQGLHRYLFAHTERDDKDVRQSARIAPLWSGEVVIGTVTVIEDVRERIAAERELRNQIGAAERARALAEEAVRVKDDFLATLSHEMRTPLNAVIGWAQMLRAKNLDAERIAHAVEVIERNATAQARLIDDMLDTARIMTGKLRLVSQPVDLSRIALAAVDVVSPTAAAKDVAIESRLQPGVMPMLGDPDRLQQIIWNLLANAIKFTPSGGCVTVGVERTDELLKLLVSDTGEGIAPEFLPHLFERFQQADPSSNRRNAGLGLGLSLVRQLVELHGGRIGVASTVGKGSTFTITFPARPELALLTNGEP
jgi:PAS domain S-box-containing protein